MTDINKLLQLGTFGDNKPRPMTGPIQLNFFGKAIAGKNPDGSFVLVDVMPDEKGNKMLPTPGDTLTPLADVRDAVFEELDSYEVDDSE
jgi:hypothetical protein